MEPTDPTEPPFRPRLTTGRQDDTSDDSEYEYEYDAEPGPPAALRLLHVEDNPSDAVLMQEYIRDACQQWDISLTGTSMTALAPEPLTVEFDTAERLGEITPERVDAADCAILDLSLPDADGLEALVALRKMSEDLPIIVLTGFDDLETGLAALRSGADDYMIKSKVDGSSLDRSVRFAIARRELTLETAAAAAAATIETANRILEQAKLSPEDLLPDLRARPWEVAPGTHRVTVQIERATGEYALVCQSCGWQALRGPGELHSWTDRGLDTVLLQHVTFGDPAGAERV